MALTVQDEARSVYKHVHTFIRFHQLEKILEVLLCTSERFSTADEDS